jgi:hypothetical protein
MPYRGNSDKILYQIQCLKSKISVTKSDKGASEFKKMAMKGFELPFLLEFSANGAIIDCVFDSLRTNIASRLLLRSFASYLQLQMNNEYREEDINGFYTVSQQNISGSLFKKCRKDYENKGIIIPENISCIEYTLKDSAFYSIKGSLLRYSVLSGDTTAIIQDSIFALAIKNMVKPKANKIQFNKHEILSYRRQTSEIQSEKDNIMLKSISGKQLKTSFNGMAGNENIDMDPVVKTCAAFFRQRPDSIDFLLSMMTTLNHKDVRFIIMHKALLQAATIPAQKALARLTIFMSGDSSRRDAYILLLRSFSLIKNISPEILSMLAEISAKRSFDAIRRANELTIATLIYNGKMNDSILCSLLYQYRSSKDKKEIIHALQVAGNAGSACSKTFILPFLNTSDTAIVVNALESLRFIHDTTASGILMLALKSPLTAIRLAALSSVRWHYASYKDHTALLQNIAMHDPVSRLRMEAIQILWKVKGLAIRSFLEELAAKEKDPAMTTAIRELMEDKK